MQRAKINYVPLTVGSVTCWAAGLALGFCSRVKLRGTDERVPYRKIHHDASVLHVFG